MDGTPKWCSDTTYPDFFEHTRHRAVVVNIMYLILPTDLYDLARVHYVIALKSPNASISFYKLFLKTFMMSYR